MQISKLFAKDINRPINGVIKVAQDDTDSIQQELSEYVVTNELQRHFADFFEAYDRAIDVPTDKVGVWISGFFGSGKSHFLKMLSYLLSNREVGGVPAVKYFDGKVADPMVYSRMQRAAAVPTESILFNIDSKGGQWKGGVEAKTALLLTFARMFYEHLGFYGEDLKLARMEQFVESQGKTDEFRAAFARINGGDWLADRPNYLLFEDDVVEVMQEVLGMSREAAQHWFDGTETAAISPDRLTDEIAAYAARRAEECGGQFRLLFMVDEVGQFIGGDVNLMLNLQTIVEDLGAKAAGRVWVMVTSQEAIDEVTRVAGNDFSKIQGRFNARLSLSSSSADEVIKRRVLEKTDAARAALAAEYDEQSAVLKNLFAFEDSQSDLRGFSGPADFAATYPFVDYQFKIMPSVLAEIRKHGNSGKHLSGGERSMLSGFQEAAQKVQERESTALVPLWRFYDTIATFLEHGIRQVIERATRAAEGDAGLVPDDVRVLKTLYLIRYLNDIKPTVGNIAILMVDDMGVDKIVLREAVKGSLDRLVRENYVARNGDAYHFLTDEEQDVAREIKDTRIDAAAITEEIKKIVFDGLYTARKYRKGANDFAFDRFVDDTIYGQSQNGMKLNVVTVGLPELSEADDGTLALKSTDKALVVLPEGDDRYYEALMNAARIKKYVNTQNVPALSPSRQNIIKGKQAEAARNKKEAQEYLEEALGEARVAVNGRMVDRRALGGRTAKATLDGALDELVSSVFTKADYITAPAAGAADVIAILAGTAQGACGHRRRQRAGRGRSGKVSGQPGTSAPGDCHGGAAAALRRAPLRLARGGRGGRGCTPSGRGAGERASLRQDAERLRPERAQAHCRELDGEGGRRAGHRQAPAALGDARERCPSHSARFARGAVGSRRHRRARARGARGAGGAESLGERSSEGRIRPAGIPRSRPGGAGTHPGERHLTEPGRRGGLLEGVHRCRRRVARLGRGRRGRARVFPEPTAPVRCGGEAAGSHGGRERLPGGFPRGPGCVGKDRRNPERERALPAHQRAARFGRCRAPRPRRGGARGPLGSAGFHGGDHGRDSRLRRGRPASRRLHGFHRAGTCPEKESGPRRRLPLAAGRLRHSAGGVAQQQARLHRPRHRGGSRCRRPRGGHAHSQAGRRDHQEAHS
ncbi:MAG: BREX system P-loop protein BrxC [Adlercreutzia sp.]